jgi:two-component system, chemotaxis family, protein-glutamate methylesterase/glutaminase
MPARRIRTLIVDDSALVRRILEDGLKRDPHIEVVGSAPDVYVARDQIIQKKPDVISLDVEMPRMDGVEFLRRLMPQYPLPVVVVSSLTHKGSQITLDALEAGAVDFVTKPTAKLESGLQEMMMELRAKIKIASTANVSHWKSKRDDLYRKVQARSGGALAESTDKVVVIGASTGGTEAIKTILMELPYDFPGVVVVQHMPPGFTKAYADRLNQTCRIEVKEAQHWDRVRQGRALIAPGDFHMTVARSGGFYHARVESGEKVNGHVPSVDVLAESVAKSVGANAFGVLLTGMGYDGAKGLEKMREAGSYNIAQDEATSIVYGMPKALVDRGAADNVLPLNRVASELIRRLRK